jgi:hypothetical protein
MRVGQIFVQGRGLMDVWINGETENEFHVVTFEAVLVAGVMVPGSPRRDARVCCVETGSETGCKNT